MQPCSREQVGSTRGAWARPVLRGPQHSKRGAEASLGPWWAGQWGGSGAHTRSLALRRGNAHLDGVDLVRVAAELLQGRGLPQLAHKDERVAGAGGKARVAAPVHIERRRCGWRWAGGEREGRGGGGWLGRAGGRAAALLLVAWPGMMPCSNASERGARGSRGAPLLRQTASGAVATQCEASPQGCLAGGGSQLAPPPAPPT